MKSIRKLILDMDVILLVVAIILFVFGLLNIVNASSQAVVIRFNTSLYNFFYKQLAAIVLGLFVTIIILKIPSKKYYFWGPLAYCAVIGGLVYLTLFGDAYQGSTNWIKIAGFTLQPSELAKPALVLMSALLFEKFCKFLQNPKLDNKSKWTLISIILGIGAVFPLIIFFQKDLGTMIILSLIFGFLFLTSPIRKPDKMSAVMAVVVVLVFGSMIIINKEGTLLTPSQASRLTFTDPCTDYEDGGYQICNGFIAINEGGLFGSGIGNSKQISYLPESHTDSVFAIIAEEYGFIFCSIIFFLYLVVLYRIFNLACRANTIRGKYICLGIGVYIALHIIINLGGLFGSMPLTGVPLPFLSYGGSYTLSLMISLALVQRISIETHNQRINI